MFLSIFEIFKLGVGPSSSHTMGPMLAARRFVEDVAAMVLPAGELSLTCRLYGSLAYTGEGHGTFRAVLCGLLGITPERYDRVEADAALERLAARQTLTIGNRDVPLDPNGAIVAERGKRLPAHPNALAFELRDASGDVVFGETYYSVGGGFVMTEAEMQADRAAPAGPDVPYPFATAAQMLEMGQSCGL